MWLEQLIHGEPMENRGGDWESEVGTATETDVFSIMKVMAQGGITGNGQASNRGEGLARPTGWVIQPGLHPRICAHVIYWIVSTQIIIFKTENGTKFLNTSSWTSCFYTTMLPKPYLKTTTTWRQPWIRHRCTRPSPKCRRRNDAISG